MRFQFPPAKHARSGFALTMTLLFMVVLLLIFASIFSWSHTNAILTSRNNQFNTSQNAAESAVERVIGQMDRDFVSASISNAAAYKGLPATIDQSSWPAQYTFTGTNRTDTSGGANGISVIFGPASTNTVPLNSQYAGLYGLAQSVDVVATATPISQQYTIPATVHESLQFANIPLFQFAIFYNVNLEIDPGAAMTITGPVFCNQNIWEGSTVCTFASSVTAVGTNCSMTANPFALNYNGTGPAIFAGGIPVNNANSLVMPIGIDNSPASIVALLGLPPVDYAMGSPAAYSSMGLLYPANGADLYITNFSMGTNDGIYTPSGTNMIAYFQDSSLSALPYDYFLITNANLHTLFVTNFISTNLLGLRTNIYYAGYTWVTNIVFYDWREGWNAGNTLPSKRVEAVQINLGLLNKWLTNNTVPINGTGPDGLKLMHAGHHIDSVYVYNSVPLSTSVLPAVRVVNGKMLPNPGGSTAGFTVATPFPLYVLGDYNAQNTTGFSVGVNSTSNTYPAALMGDAITILSTNWSDAVTTKLPSPGNTTVNAAMLEGIVPSNPAISGNYSGGVENFMRLLENWNKTLTYNGSIVVLFYSQYATNSWQPTGNYYNAPSRNWAFDMNFRSASKLPPLTPCIKAMIRGNWYAHN